MSFTEIHLLFQNELLHSSIIRITSKLCFYTTIYNFKESKVLSKTQ